MSRRMARARRAPPAIDWLWNQMPLVALIVVCAVAALLSDRFLSPLNINNVLMQGAVITVITIGMTYVIICGGFDLSVGSVVAFCRATLPSRCRKRTCLWPGGPASLCGARP